MSDPLEAIVKLQKEIETIENKTQYDKTHIYELNKLLREAERQRDILAKALRGLSNCDGAFDETLDIKERDMGVVLVRILRKIETYAQDALREAGLEEA